MSDQDDAKALVDDFEKRTAPNSWPHLTRSEVASGLRSRIDDPDNIDQGNTSLCGPADFTRDIAEDRPKDYARAVIQLFETGGTRIGDLDIRPGHDLRGHILSAGAGIAQVDWIILASIRDSDNWFFDYQSESDDASAITMPHSKESWLKKAGYREVINDTNAVACKDLPNAIRASSLFSQGYKVALFINANMLSADDMNDVSLTPDHWVALTKPIKVQSFNVAHPGTLNEDPNSRVELEVYSWGKTVAVPPGGKRLTDYHFRCNYYGFIACRR